MVLFVYKIFAVLCDWLSSCVCNVVRVIVFGDSLRSKTLSLKKN